MNVDEIGNAINEWQKEDGERRCYLTLLTQKHDNGRGTIATELAGDGSDIAKSIMGAMLSDERVRDIVVAGVQLYWRRKRGEN